ncbi:MAG TPA: VLRF1 family aeRF1-type release factor [Natronosporangium sp.]
MTDEIGILSIYVTFNPHYRVEAPAKPPWELRLRQQLGQLSDRLRDQGPREHWKALTARLDALQPDLTELLDPTASGQGRALFAGVASGEVRTVALQVPLGDQVVLEPDPHLRPLLAAWSTAGPAGVVSVSADELRILDLRFGFTEPVGVIPYPGSIEQRELKGPAPTGGQFFQRSAPQHDLYERREDDKLARHLRSVGPRLAGLVSEWEWSYLVLTGEAPLVQAVREGLPAQLPAELLTLDHQVGSLPPAKIAATVAPALDEARHRRHRQLAIEVRDKAMSGNAGACGLSQTLTALQEGRVAHLLLDAERRWAGRRTDDGVFVPDGEVPPGVEVAALRPEPHLDERMIELAFREGARVTMLAPAAAAPLADVDGIGATLRW